MSIKGEEHRGTSLIEVLISSGLALALFGLITGAIIFATRHYKRLMSANELEETCVLIMESISSEFSESRLQSVFVEPETLVFPRPRDSAGRLTRENGSGALLWSSQVCYIRNNSNNHLTRYVEEFPPDVMAIDPGKMSPLRDGAYFQSSVPVSKILSREVTEFGADFVVPDGADADTDPDLAPRRQSRFLRLRLVLERPGPKLTRIEVNLNANARN